jgi:hypothetical protein
MQLDHGIGVRESELPWVDIGVRPGYKQRYHGFYDKSRKIGCRIGSLYADPYYHSPRHRHTFQQVRYLVGGKMKYGREVYNEGDCLYIPEGAYYGPIKPVPVEKGGSEQMHFVDIQFEGPSGIPYPEPDDVVAAQRSLAETGTFEEGVYTFADGRKRDAYEAILEKLTGKRTTYPEPRLTSYVVMRTEEYPWRAHPTLAGVSHKHLGYFFECGPNIKLTAIKAGSAIPAGRPVGHRAVFLTKGSVRFDGQEFTPLSYFMLPGGASSDAIAASEDAELLVVGWAPQGDEIPFELF